MSHGFDETYKVYCETERTARKAHTCHACFDTISVGHRYWYISAVLDGVTVIKRCLRCQLLHKHLRSLAPGELWPNEQLDCGEDYLENWGREPPEEIRALAFKTAEEMQNERLIGKRDYP